MTTEHSWLLAAPHFLPERNTMNRRLSIILLVFSLLPGLAAAAPPTDTQRLAKSFSPFVQCFAGKRENFNVSADVIIKQDDKKHKLHVQLEQFGAETLNLEIRHKDYWVRVERRPDKTAMILPLHKVAFVGCGEVDGHDILKPRGLLNRVVSTGSNVGLYLPILTGGDTNLLTLMITTLINPKYDQETNTWSHKNEYFWKFDDEETTFALECKAVDIKIDMDDATIRNDTPIKLDGLKVTELDRVEVERQLSRGIRRTLEVLSPSPQLTNAKKEPRKVPNGELRWIEGERVVLLHGTPEQIGKAHGQLLKAEADRCIDSVLYAFGTFQTIRSGRWFRHELHAAHERLAPYIPERHMRETVAMAKAIDLDPQLAKAMNVFPELFHCSGFAIFGKATKGGKLYHGRVLDYMTTIGLQDAAASFVIAPEGQIPFITVGYAGFIGSVTGMNARSISLGEMGGGGEGQWDGVPMATLMRRAMEECSTLDEVKALWKNSPRTCEYYYVFADGKTNDAVGVAATPKEIEFVLPGASHPRLGDGIEDTVLLSSGSRLATLKARVKERYGEFDAQAGQWLMSRPVAMKSNLHNVLFVPEDGVLYIANADHKRPAAERPYTKLDLRELLKSMPIKPASTRSAKLERKQ